MVEFEKSRTGVITLKYNNKYIHSKYDPIGESKKFAEGNIELINAPVILLYGIGLGYNIDSIVEKMNPTSQLYVFENNEELVKCCKKVNEKIFKYKNVHIIYGNNKKFYNELSKCLEKVNNFIVHRASLETIKQSNEFLYNLINDFANMKQFDRIHSDIAVRSEENFDINTKNGYKNINYLLDQYKNNSKPYIVASAGPSLDYDLSLLKKYEDKFNIIAVGASLITLIKNNIKPQIVVIVDTKETIKNQFSGVDCRNINLCFDACASRWAVESYNGPKYIFNDESKDDISIRKGGTVAVSAIDIAVKFGAKDIILLGQDLAFVDGKSHTEVYEDMYNIKDTYKQKNILKQVKGANGNVVYTNQGYITFRNRIEALIRANEKVKFINCSSGAFINGALHMKLSEYINNNIK